jgi:hypothetical protein
MGAPIHMARDLDIEAARRVAAAGRGNGQAGEVEHVGALLGGVGMQGHRIGDRVEAHACQRLQFRRRARAGRERMAWRFAAHGRHHAIAVVHDHPEMMEIVFERCPNLSLSRPVFRAVLPDQLDPPAKALHIEFPDRGYLHECVQ